MPFNVPEKEMLKKAISMKLHDIQEKYFQRKILDKVTYDKKISLLEDIVEKLGIQDVNITTNEESVTRQRVVL
tara:strand:- start:4484 stop:4702 length:219 start_codon:yes stop_codon:yes gene_type:complete